MTSNCQVARNKRDLRLGKSSFICLLFFYHIYAGCGVPLFLGTARKDLLEFLPVEAKLNFQQPFLAIASVVRDILQDPESLVIGLVHQLRNLPGPIWVAIASE